MGLVLAIDVGTTNLKAGVVEADGHLACVAKRQLSIERPSEGAAEHNPEKLRTALIEICQEVTAAWRSSISLVVLSTYQFGLIVYDKEWKALTGITTLLDTRARQTHGEFQSWIQPEEVYETTGCPPFAQHAFSRLYYFKRREPQLFDRVRYAMSGKAWLLKTLTGEFVTDPSTDCASQMLNLQKRDWDDALVKRLGWDRSMLPRIVDPMGEALEMSSSVKEAIGLRGSVRVLPGVYDGGALAIGLGGLEEGVAVSNVGTSGMLRVASESPQLDKTGRMRFQTYCLLKDRYLVGAAINNATLPLKWLKDNLISDDYAEIFKLLKDSTPGAGNLFFLPYLTGEREPVAGHLASGVLFGLRDFHTKSDILRSLVEGVAYSLNLIREAFVDNKINFGEIRMGGGGAKFDPWVQTFSDVLNARIVRAGCEEAALIGSAILGFSHLGEFSSLAEASAKMVDRGESFVPDAALVNRYRKHFEFYKSLYRDFQPLYRRHTELGAA